MFFIDYKGLSTVSVEQQNNNCLQLRLLHQTLRTDTVGLSNTCVLPGGGCTGAVYLSVRHSCCSYRVMNHQQIRKNKTLLLNKQRLLDKTIITNI